MPPLSFPTTQEINHIVRNTVVNISRFRGNEFCPIIPAYAAQIQVDVINATAGITPPHALNADPKIAALSGQSIRTYATGYWRETYRLNEEELLYARQEGTYNERAGRLRVTRRSNEMNSRLETRIEKLRWDPIILGQIAVNEGGVKYTVDMKVPNGNKRTYPWISDPTRDVLKDIAELQELYFGTGAKLDTIYINNDIAKAWAANTAIQNLLKQSVYAMSLSANNIPKAMQILFPEVKIEVYTEGYATDAGTFTPFIPLGKFACVGKGDEIGMDFCTTIALQNGGMESPQPGKFAAVEDKSMSEKNPYVDITVGINGLPRMHHPNWYVNGTAN
jgi:hypothetical protein